VEQLVELCTEWAGANSGGLVAPVERRREPQDPGSNSEPGAPKFVKTQKPGPRAQALDNPFKKSGKLSFVRWQPHGEKCGCGGHFAGDLIQLGVVLAEWLRHFYLGTA